MTKSKISCIWSIQDLGGRDPGRRAVPLYHWTFTFLHVLPPAVASLEWSKVAHTLSRWGWEMVRVYEMHPGGHGLHVHCITNRRHDIHEVLQLLHGTPLGRVDVRRVSGESWRYVAKYVCKQAHEGLLKGRRLWACIGFEGSLVRDCIVKTPWDSFVQAVSADQLMDSRGMALQGWQRLTMKMQIGYKNYLDSLVADLVPF